MTADRKLLSRVMQVLDKAECCLGDNKNPNTLELVRTVRKEVTARLAQPEPDAGVDEAAVMTAYVDWTPEVTPPTRFEAFKAGYEIAALRSRPTGATVGVPDEVRACLAEYVRDYGDNEDADSQRLAARARAALSAAPPAPAPVAQDYDPQAVAEAFKQGLQTHVDRLGQMAAPPDAALTRRSTDE